MQQNKYPSKIIHNLPWMRNYWKSSWWKSRNQILQDPRIHLPMDNWSTHKNVEIKPSSYNFLSSTSNKTKIPAHHGDCLGNCYCHSCFHCHWNLQIHSLHKHVHLKDSRNNDWWSNLCQWHSPKQERMQPGPKSNIIICMPCTLHFKLNVLLVYKTKSTSFKCSIIKFPRQIIIYCL